MIRFIYNRLWILILALAGCDDERVGPVEKYAMLEIVSGNNQAGITGQFLKDSIIIKVIPKNSSLKAEQFYVRAKMTKGNGYLAEMYYYNVAFAAANGKIRTSWSLGCDEKDQQLTFYLYNYDNCILGIVPAPVCVAVDSITINATSSTPLGWNRSCGIVDPDSYNIKFRTYNGVMYAASRGLLFQEVRKETLWWEKINGLPVSDVIDFDFNSTGKIFILSENHGVFTSNDMKIWNSVSDGLLDPRYPVGFLVEDSVVYVSYLFDGLYRLRSGSTFWKKLLINGRYDDQYTFPTRHPNGTLYVKDKWDDIWQSENSGDLWSDTGIGYPFTDYRVTDFQINPSGQLYIGSNAMLSILDPDTYTGQIFNYNQWGANVNNITFRDDGVYYLVDYTPNSAIYSSALGYQTYEIGFEGPFERFVFDLQGRVMVAKYEGVYYRKE